MGTYRPVLLPSFNRAYLTHEDQEILALLLGPGRYTNITL